MIHTLSYFRPQIEGPNITRSGLQIVNLKTIGYAVWFTMGTTICWSIYGVQNHEQTQVLEFHKLVASKTVPSCKPSLMSSPCYFFAIWIGTKKGLGEIKALLRNYLWYGSKNMTWACVSWDDCTIRKKIGGMSLTLPEDAMKTLTSKWIIQALPPSKSNPQSILMYGITQLQPSYHDTWGPSSLWLFSPNFSIKGGSKVWRHINQMWKMMVSTIA